MTETHTSRIRAVSPALLIALAAGGAVAGGTPCLGPQTAYGTGDAPGEVALGDIDGDGDRDMLVSNRASATVSVLLNNGSGLFTSAPPLSPVGTSAEKVALADMDNDGDLDAVVTVRRTGAPDRVLIYPGDGSGGFGAATEAVTGDGVGGLAVSDLNGDGNLDAVTTDTFNNRVYVNLGNGDGTLGARTAFDSGVLPKNVAAGDLDNDGNPDAVTVDRADGTVSVLMGVGDGTFAARMVFATGNLPEDIALADMNGDGNLDIVNTNLADDPSIGVLLGNGDGTFGPGTEFEAGITPHGLDLADLDGDGDPDAAITNRDSDTGSVLFNSGAGTLSAQQAFRVGDRPTNIKLADLDGDGDPDLAVTNEDDDSVGVVMNRYGDCFDTGLEYLGSFAGHDYFATQPMTIHQARQAASALAAEHGLTFNTDVYLAAIGSVEEENALLAAGATNSFIGFSDETSEGSFVWDNGEGVTYTNWRPGEPNNDLGIEHYTVMNFAGAGGWNDIPGNLNRRAIIEIGAPGVHVVGEGGFGSIQAAVDAAAEGDTILVTPGVHHENIVMNKSLEMHGLAGAHGTILDGGRAGRVITVTDGTGTNRFEGLTIQNGEAFGGGGMRLSDEPYTVSDTIIRMNRSTNDGGGVTSFGAAGRFINTLVYGNESTNEPGGIGGFEAQLSFDNCTVVNNDGDGIRVIGNGNSLRVRNSIVRGNTTQVFAHSLDIAYSNIEGGAAGTGNIDADPLFADAAAGDYSLGAGSPSIDSGDSTAVPAGVTTDLDGNPRFVDDPSLFDTGVANGGGVVVDMGACEAPGDLAGCSLADLGEPHGVLDLLDINAFIAEFLANRPLADLNRDGIYDLTDIGLFVQAFQAGCP